MSDNWRLDCIISGVTKATMDAIFDLLVDAVEIEGDGATIVGSVLEHEEAGYVEEDSSSV